MSDVPPHPALAPVLARHPGATPFRFGDGPTLCDALTDLVLSGVKTATCGALRDYPPGDPDRPVVGRRDVACRWDGTPAAVIETIAVTELPFDAVPEAFALAEGEGTFDEWRAGHVAFFTRNGGWSPDMILLCERFRLVERI
ncbi:ASCH domain-containing protein [Jannaschia sp. LMIT008]|uniref:ASCH domain-containing protein n=1 Tax=Jannaschia maritima TaxID=3032585 RepID=UPI0028119A13|nr:ASCH domain-containing protein [Jannaschia sp. LMIT008]